MTDATEAFDEKPMLDLSVFRSLEEAISVTDTSGSYWTTLAANLSIESGSPITMNLFFAESIVSRCQGTHEAIVREIRHENPHAVFPLLRSLVETFTLLHYVTDHPQYIESLTVRAKDIPKGRRKRVSMQKLIAYAFVHAPGLKNVYAELSEITHFGSAAMWISHRIEDPDLHTTSWTNNPRWRDMEQPLIACAQTIEISEAINVRLTDFLTQHCGPDQMDSIGFVTQLRETS